MAWKKVSPDMCDLLEEALAGFDKDKRRMFGCPAYFINDNWFAGVHEDNVLIRLDEGARQEIMEAFDEASIFEPMAGRPMKEFVVLPEGILSDREELGRWLARSYDWVKTWPPKVKKAKRTAGKK